MEINESSYLQLKSTLIDIFAEDITSYYQLGYDLASNSKLKSDYFHLVLALKCFQDDYSLSYIKRAYRLFNSYSNADAEDKIDSYLDLANSNKG